MALQAKDFHAAAAPVIQQLKAEKLDQKQYSDTLDASGKQYVDLVMEGGGVLGIALAGYVYTLEQAGLRFVGLGGTSAGSITALVLAALDEPSRSKSDRLVEVLANIPMRSFIDGKHDRDRHTPLFIQSMLKRPKLSTGLWKGMQALYGLNKIQGLNRGDRFHAWLTSFLDSVGIRTTDDLRQRMATTPSGWHLREDSLYRSLQLEEHATLPDLDPTEDHLCIVAADIATETKVEFPHMAGLYWESPGDVNPANYVRCSMSIPVFFRPFRVPLSIRDEEHLKLWDDLAGINGHHTDHARNAKFPPSEACFVDGGILSNFPIDAFHKKKKMPTRPTFGVKLQLDNRSNEIPRFLTLLTQTFNASRHCLDYEFIRKNPDYKQVVAYIDTGEHNWLNFDMSDQDKLDLFFRGAETARVFLDKFNWAKYKATRQHIADAFHQASSKKKTLEGTTSV